MTDLTRAGLVMAGTVAAVGFFLHYWELHRSRWSRPSRWDILSVKLRHRGIVLLWVEALLMAIGSLLPTKVRNDLLLFVSVWAIVGLLAVLLVAVSISDAIVRMMARKERLADLRREIVEAIGQPSAEPDDFEPPPDDDEAY